MKKTKMTPVVVMHYVKLVLRGALFLAALAVYVYHALAGGSSPFGGLEQHPVLVNGIWLFYMVDMLLRFFPNRLESPGCQKQFAKNYIPIPGSTPKNQAGILTFAVFAAWIALNATIAAIYYAGLIDRGILLLISLAYSVCDIICILFFCPFQTWIMKNRCCTTCRIYNWDYAMMFTPLILIPGFHTWSLLAMAMGLLFQWEFKRRRFPERFSPCSNGGLACVNCSEKLCRHKSQLRRFLRKYKFDRFGQRVFKN